MTFGRARFLSLLSTMGLQVSDPGSGFVPRCRGEGSSALQSDQDGHGADLSVDAVHSSGAPAGDATGPVAAFVKLVLGWCR